MATIVVSLAYIQTSDGTKLQITNNTDYTGYDVASIDTKVFTILNLWNNATATITTSGKIPTALNAVVQLDAADLLVGKSGDILPDAVYIANLSFKIDNEQVDPDTHDTATSADTIITYYNIDCLLDQLTSQLPTEETTKDLYINKEFTTLMYREGAIAAHKIAKYPRAQSLLNRALQLLKFVAYGN